MATKSKLYGHFSFVNDIDERFICPICQEVMKDPQLMACCGKKICFSCLEKSCRNREESCPFCRTKEEECEYPILHLLEKGMKSEIESFHVYCINKEAGCEWKGELRESDKHLQTCGYVKVQCSNKCESHDGTITEIFRKDLDSHLTDHCELRRMNCPHCDQLGTVKDFPDHEMVCEMFPVECPNDGCEKPNLVRKTLHEHRTTCEYEVINCGNFNSGCREQCQRRKMDDHMTSKCSRRMIECRYCCKQYFAIDLNGHEVTCDHHPEECPNNCHQEGLTRITLSQHIEVCPLEDIKCNFYPIGCSDKVKRKDMDDHIETRQGHHLKLMTSAYKDLKKSKKKAEDDVKNLSEELDRVQQTLKEVESVLQANEDKTEQRTTKLHGELEAVEHHIPPPKWNSIQRLIYNPKPLTEDWMVFSMTGFSQKCKDDNREWSSPLFTLGDVELYLHVRFYKEKHSFDLQLRKNNIEVDIQQDYEIKINIQIQDKGKNLKHVSWEEIHFKYLQFNQVKSQVLASWPIPHNQQWQQKFAKNDTLVWKIALHTLPMHASRDRLDDLVHAFYRY